MAKITKILVPLNGTKSSTAGLDMAISVAKHHGAAITGVCVTDTKSHSEFGGSGQVADAVKRDVNKMLKDAKELASKNGVAFNGKMASGDAGYNIIKMAHDKKNRFDLIVIGSRKRGVVRKLFLGSVSNYIIQSSKIPVMIVK